MTEIKHILMASNFAEGCRRALMRAVQLKQETAASLTLLHVVEPGLTKSPASIRRADAEAALANQLAEAMQDELRLVTIEVLEGDPVRTIATEAQARGADVVVLGEPAHHRRTELFAGTTVERVIRQSECPVLVVKAQPAEEYRRVLVAYDFSEAAERALDVALSVAPHAEFLLVHAGAKATREGRHAKAFDEERVRARMIEAAERARHRSGYPDTRIAAEIVEGHPASVLLDAARAFPADLLAIGTHGRGRLHALLFGSVARELAAMATCDVLTARP
jgi:nucleotide-binding universal stress UspA family protein